MQLILFEMYKGYDFVVVNDLIINCICLLICAN